ncbi:YppE family protein [Halobacillus yeomjeoni]|uniref:YppE family protein n=1 Tax=Halobacillus yeomjeoni TaxID=311194 RepID=UPI001CD40380|nr:YppE family protein [Halobacillus yeomjeoni]MCA0983061.1 YppE family protein [Halobacillus yeomjeoni]
MKQHTKELKQLIDRLHLQFIESEGPVDKKDHAFFNKVKQETGPMFEINEAWRDEAEVFVKERKASVHPNQVKSTHENIEMIILHSYYLDVDRKRFKELYQSVHYVLDMMLNDLSE